jgi:hypothetical protein
MRAVACLAVVVSVVASVVVGCGDDAGSVSNTVAKLVGPEGGTVELVGGGKVVIPAGALTEQVEIKITELKLADLADLPANMEAAGKPYAFQPHGQNFAQSVKIEVPIEGNVAQVRPLKLDDDKDTSWQTIFPSVVDSANKKLSMDTTGFSVIVAARPRANSGVITLPDGAVVSDAGGDASMAPDAGIDSGTDAAMAVDAGMDAAVNMTPCTATAVAVTAIAAPGDVLVNGARTMVTMNSSVLTAYTGSGAGLTAAGDLITLGTMEYFNGVATGGSIVTAVTSTSTGSGRVAIAPVDGSSAATFYDLINYAAYGAIYDGRPTYGYSPTGDRVATDGATIAVAMTNGALILFSAGTGQPLGFLGVADITMNPVAGAIGMEFSGNYLIVAINIPPGNMVTFNAIRVFDISNPANIVMVDEAVRSAAVSGGSYLTADPARSRFLLSLGVNAQVVGFSVNGTGQISAENVVATGISGAQARSIAVVGDLLVLGNPNFTPQPVDVALGVFGLTGTASVSRGVIDLPDGDYSTSMAVGGNIVYSVGATLNAIDLTSCLTP